MRAEFTEIFLPALLQRNDSETWDQRRKAVLLLETTSVSEEQRPLLLLGLQSFINTYKFVENEQTITAVCAALRKYILNMRPEDTVYVSGLLKPTETQSLSNLAELTIVKSICRYLQLFPVQQRRQHAELEEQLCSTLRDYLKPKLILQKNLDAISMNALLGLVLLASAHCEEYAELLKELSVTWFSELLVRRLDVLAKEISGSEQSFVPEVRETLDLLRTVVQSSL